MSIGLLNESYLNNVAFYDEELDLEITYRQLDTDIRSVGGYLKTDKRSLVLLLTENNYVSICLYLSCLHFDYPVMLVDSTIKRELLDEIITNYAPDYIVTNATDFDKYGETINIVTERVRVKLIQNKQASDVLLNDQLSLLLSTSGSTGSSKFVRLSKENILANAASIAQYLTINSKQVAVTNLPFHYSYGLSIINSHLFSGAKSVITRKSVVEKGFWELFRNHQVTTFSGVPYTYQILERFRFKDMELPSLQYLTQAGGHLNEKTKRYFIDYCFGNKKRLVVMYGQTEATARIAYVPYEDINNKLDSIGKAIPGGVISILGDNGEITEANVAGEIIYEGKNVMLGYAINRSDLSMGDELQGILKTGDLGYKDEDGFVYINGRINRFLKVFGNRVNLDEVEKMLETIFESRFAVSGIDDKVFVLEENEVDRKKEVIKCLVDTYHFHFTAFNYLYGFEIPMKTNKKKDYQMVKNLFTNG